ncbi:MAG TPA: hypothetical protein VLJ42_10305 [Solirubrobacteraceae bacterium]|nr:hypothetical protein [Solirubrobacteraceae bacterium]
MNALITDATAAPESARAPASAPSTTPAAGAPPEQLRAPDEQLPAPERACASCGAELKPSQEWCLQCGTAVPKRFAGGPGWRTAAAILGATTALVIGAAVASYAALNKRSTHTHTNTAATTTVAQTPSTGIPGATSPLGAPPTSSTPTPTSPTSPITPITPTTSGTITPSLPSSTTVTPPKIPLTTPTPSGGVPTPTTSTPTTSPPTTTTPANTTPAKTPPSPILLDTDAASTYNPYSYPVAGFGDPSLTIDGDTTTDWTAQLNPAVAPRLAEGVVVDLKTPRRLGALKVVTTTPGLSIEVYGANGHTLPPTITDPAWTRLGATHAQKKTQRLKLHGSANQHRFLLVWLVKAPDASVGTAQAPGSVSLNELSLFPPA